MPVAAASTAGMYRDIVRELANACILQFAAIRGPGNGVGNGSCCASVRVANTPAGLPDYRFGNSQAQYLDADAINAGGMFNAANHAERQAHNAGTLAGGYAPHLFVELPPCGGAYGCAAWCAATIAGVNVWYLYPNSVAMVAAHAGGTAAEFLALNAALP